jgi:hypothetical protein
VETGFYYRKLLCFVRAWLNLSSRKGQSRKYPHLPQHLVGLLAGHARDEARDGEVGVQRGERLDHLRGPHPGVQQDARGKRAHRPG